MCALGFASRRALIAGRVRMKSPIAPPRITRMRFTVRSILRNGAGENCHAVERGEAVNDAAANIAVCAPVNLVAQQVRHRHPKQTGHNHEISEHRYKKAARFVAEESPFQERLGREQTENSKRADGEEFFNESEHEPIAHWQND